MRSGATSQRESYASLKDQTVEILTVTIRRLGLSAKVSGVSKADQILPRLHNVAMSANNNGR